MVLFYNSLGILIYLIEILILVRIIMSIIRMNSNNILGKLVYELTEPVLEPARKLIAKLGINTGMFDFSPLLAMILLNLFYGLIRIIIF